MKILEIDEKWAIEYDSDNNCRPVTWLRYGSYATSFDEDKAVECLFYALLTKSNELRDARASLSDARNKLSRLRWPDTTGQ